MNSVHLVTKEKYRVENQYEKPNRVHEHLTGPAGMPRCTQAARTAPRPCSPCLLPRPCRARPAACAPATRAPAACAPCALPRSRESARAPAVFTPAYAPACAPRAHAVPLLARALRAQPPAPGTLRLRTQCQHAQRPAPAPSAVSWPVPRHSPAAHCSSCHNTIFVLRYKLPAAKPPKIQSCNTIEPSSLQYKKLYCNIVSKPTTPILQYNPSLNQPPSSHLGCNTNLVLQYNSHNKIWAVAKFNFFLQIFFFFRFSL